MSQIPRVRMTEDELKLYKYYKQTFENRNNTSAMFYFISELFGFDFPWYEVNERMKKNESNSSSTL